jgi:hypothetical protein
VFRGAGNILGAFLGTKMRRQERDYNREQDYAARKDFEDYKNKSKVKSNLIEGFASPMVVGNYFDVANKTLGKDHPDVVAGTRQANDFERPEFAHFVNNFGIQTSKHGILPGQPAKGEAQEKARAARIAQQDEISKQNSSNNEYSGTVARFGKDGKMSRESVSLEDIEYGDKLSERPPASMREVDASSRPSNQTFTAQQKADLERERPRTGNLNTGINEGKGGNSNPAEVDVGNAWGEGKITSEEAADLIPGKSRMKNDISAYGKSNDNDDTIQATHTRAGLKDRNGTKY